MDAPVLRHDCFKIGGDAHILSAAQMQPATVCGFWQYIKAYADICRGSLVRWCQIRLRSSKMRVFSFDRYVFCMNFATGTDRALHIEIYTTLRGFLAIAQLLYINWEAFKRLQIKPVLFFMHTLRTYLACKCKPCYVLYSIFCMYVLGTCW